MLDAALGALAAGALLVADELDLCLHPRLSKAVVELFTDSDSNPHGAQLLFSTHNEALLNAMRRDSIVFVDKDPQTGASSLTPLSDFTTRKRDDIRRAYAEGRFGGVPVIGDLAGAVAHAMSDG